MKTLELKKIETNRKDGKFFYQVMEGGRIIAERKSNREYVACFVSPTTDGFYTPYFFGRMELVGKGDSKFLNGKCYALAILMEHQVITSKVNALVAVYKADPNCRPDLWIASEQVTEQEKQQFLYLLNK